MRACVRACMSVCVCMCVCVLVCMCVCVCVSMRERLTDLKKAHKLPSGNCSGFTSHNSLCIGAQHMPVLD